MSETTSYMGRFFDVVMKKQTYINILYLLLTFPLGIFYFVFMATGFSLGLGLLVVTVGFFILAFMVWSSKKLMTFERYITGIMLKMDYYEPIDYERGNISAFRKFFLDIGDPENWKAFIYLFFIKLPLGILNFTATVVLLSVSLGFMSAPMILQVVESNYGGDYYINSGLQYLGINLTQFQEAIVLMFIGILLAVVSLHVMNGLAYFSGKILYFMSPVKKIVNVNNLEKCHN